MRRILISISVVCILFSAALAKRQTASLILNNGIIWTDPLLKPQNSSIAIDGNKIIGVGTRQSLRKFIGRQTRIIDLGGKFVMPGINDSHVHFLSSSLGLSQVDLTGVATLEEAKTLIAKFAKENPNAPWITGRGWQYSIFPNARLPLKSDLDEIIKDRPVFLRAYDGHTAWANSKAMELAKIDAKTNFGGFGEIVRDANGDPTGTFKEDSQDLISKLIPPNSKQLKLDALKKGMELAKSLGITSIQNAHGSIGEVEIYNELLQAGELSLRSSFAFDIDSETGQTEINRIVELSKKYDSPMLRVKAVKLYVDGVIESHTAAMLEPYANRPETSGTASFTAEQLNKVVAMADKAGLQVYIHAIGDKGVRMSLDSFENAIKVNGKRDSRFRIEHIETIQTIDMQRFAELGVIASMEPIHADPGTIDVWSAAIGENRSSRGFAWRQLEKAGAKLIFSSDHPASITLSPWRGIHNAINRKTIDGFPANGWFPDNRVSLDTALKAYTSNGAFASFEENTKGRIKAGQFADLIVLDKSPFQVHPMKLGELAVVKTIFNGKIVFETKGN